jgi:hypothetical protein
VVLGCGGGRGGVHRVAEARADCEGVSDSVFGPWN